MSDSVYFTVQQTLALCGGQFPYANGFAWDTVQIFKLEEGLLLQPYADDEILPGPALRVQITAEEIGVIELLDMNTQLAWLAYAGTCSMISKSEKTSISNMLKDNETTTTSWLNTTTLGNLVQNTEEQFYKRRYFGPKRMPKIKAMLAYYGLCFAAKS